MTTAIAGMGLEGAGSVGDLVLGVAVLLVVLGGALYLGKRFDELF